MTSAKIIVLERLFDKYSKQVSAHLGNEYVITNLYGLHYINKCVRGNLKIDMKKIFRLYDDNKLKRMLDKKKIELKKEIIVDLRTKMVIDNL